MTREETLAFFAKREGAWRQRDPAALALGHAEDCTVESPMFSSVKGRAAIQKSYESLFQSFPDWDLVDEPALIDGDRVAQPFTARATHVGRFMGLEGTGRRFEVHGVMLMEMEDGLIAHERRIYDFAGLLIQVGVLRGKPGF
jgi:steroid delta-isomerase-like uncharacterized protein